MHRREPLSRLQMVLLSCTTILMLLCGVGVLLVAWPAKSAAQAAEFAAARERWAARPFTSYRMVIVDLRCRMEVDVVGEHVVRTMPRNCPQGSRTIDELFQLIERDGTIGIPCAYTDCSCDDVYNVRARFDPQYGFPLLIEVRLTPTANWRHPDFWVASFERRSLVRCDQVEGSKEIIIESITPLP